MTVKSLCDKIARISPLHYAKRITSNLQKSYHTVSVARNFPSPKKDPKDDQIRLQKGDPQKDFDNFTLNLSEAKMKIAYPQNENSVSYRGENICWAFLKIYVVM